MNRRRWLLSLLAGSALGVIGAGSVRAQAGRAGELTLYRTPGCGCCLAWAEHLAAAGFGVTVRDMPDLAPVRARLGVPPDLAGCHSATVAGYAIEGHVPAREVLRLLREQPPAIGLSVPGMPVGSPGMESEGAREPYQVILFGGESRRVYASYA